MVAVRDLLSMLAQRDDPYWQALAACRDAEPGLFFPDNSGPNARAAKRVCASCEVRPDCLAYALDNDEPHGIWGGLTVRERRKLRRRAQGRRPNIVHG